MKLKPDRLDKACQEIKGHTNWAYFDTLTPQEQEKALQDETVVVFYDNEKE